MLGRGAPRRALHELGVRSGLTGRRYARAARRAAGRATPVAAPPLGPVAPVPSEAARRCRARADALLDGSIEVFGRDVPLDLAHGPVGDWHRDPATDARWPSDRPWWRIDVRGPERPADVKWTWEAARHRHLVALARAAHLQPDDARTAAALDAGLRGWAEAVPLERSVHWLSNLELALRSLAWLQCFALAPDALAPATRRGAETELRVTATHLALDLRRTRHSMANNHLVGDLVGLAALQTALGEPTTETDAALAAQVAAEVRADGSMIEESLSYHRFVLDLLAARVLVGGAPAEVGAALERGGRWLARLGVLDGPVPQHGDWDEGRALVSTAPAHDLQGTTLLALSLAGTGADPAWRAAHDEVAWHARPGDPVDPEPAATGGDDLGGGIARVAVGPWTTWLRASGGGWHGHSDHTAVVVHHDGRVVVGDPGTGAYNGRDDERRLFRSSLAHDVLRVDGHDQLEPHRQFRWRHRAGSAVGPALHHRRATICWATHDAWQRLDPPRRAVRVVWTDPTRVVVADWVHPSVGRWDLSIPLHPDARLAGDHVVAPGGARLRLHTPPASTHRGEDGPLDGWWSPTYGRREPSTRLACDGELHGLPVVWSVALPRTPLPEVDDDGTVTIDGTTLRTVADERGCQLEVGDADGPTSVATLTWPDR